MRSRVKRFFTGSGSQLLDSGTSQAANYRAACRARSTADFIAKLKIVEEESDEAHFWVDRLVDAGLPEPLHQQARDLQALLLQVTRMTVASIRTTRERQRAKREAVRPR
jgi:four helix bundle protein